MGSVGLCSRGWLEQVSTKTYRMTSAGRKLVTSIKTATGTVVRAPPAIPRTPDPTPTTQPPPAKPAVPPPSEPQRPARTQVAPPTPPRRTDPPRKEAVATPAPPPPSAHPPRA